MESGKAGQVESGNSGKWKVEYNPGTQDAKSNLGLSDQLTDPRNPIPYPALSLDVGRLVRHSLLSAKALATADGEGGWTLDVGLPFPDHLYLDRINRIYRIL